MNIFTKKNILIGTLALAIILAVAVPYFALAASKAPKTKIWSPSILKGPLITCTGDGTGQAGLQACQNLCDLVSTIINIIYFLIGVVLWVIVPILVTVGGVMYMVAGANHEMLGTAKKTITGAVIGLVIVLCSWLIINTFVTFFGITGIGGFGSNSSCTVAPAPAATTTTS